MSQQDDRAQFELDKQEDIKAMAEDRHLAKLSHEWFLQSLKHRYSYQFTWLGLPIIQYPSDILAVSELIWQIKPDLIIETGIARGGSLILSASLLQLIGGEGRVLGIDIDIRAHNKQAILEHPLVHRIDLLEGSSIDPKIINQVYEKANKAKTCMVLLDSMHTKEHVAAELEAYAPLVTQDSYIIVFDTVIADMPASASKDRPWGPDNNPKQAVHEFLLKNPRFEIDKTLETKLQISVAPSGYLKARTR